MKIIRNTKPTNIKAGDLVRFTEKVVDATLTIEGVVGSVGNRTGTYLIGTDADRFFAVDVVGGLEGGETTWDIVHQVPDKPGSVILVSGQVAFRAYDADDHTWLWLATGNVVDPEMLVGGFERVLWEPEA